MCCCRFCICAASRPATSSRRLRRSALLGRDAPNLSPSVIGRLRARREQPVSLPTADELASQVRGVTVASTERAGLPVLETAANRTVVRLDILTCRYRR